MKRLLLIFFVMTLILVACSTDKNTSNQIKPNENEETTEENKVEYKPKKVKYYEIDLPEGKELSEIEKELLRKPGIYSGNQYNEEKVKRELDQLPGDLSSEEYLEELKYLLSEDYREEMETFINFDSTIDVDLERPDESIDIPTLKTAHYAILIDASGSMKELNGNKTRMEAAKEAVLEFAEMIPENATVSLRVYGHKGSGTPKDKDLSCGSTESYFNGTFEKDAFQEALDKVDGKGYTPIALALETVTEDIPEEIDEAVVYVVSDGIETCGGDPVTAAKELVESNVETVVNIIGFDVDNEGQKVLKEVAEAGNGEFTYVGSEQDLKKYLREQYEEIQRAWQEWKEEGKKQAIDLKEEKKKLAFDTKESMKEKANLEKERMKKAQQYLRGKYSDIPNHPTRTKLFSLVVNYGNEKWRYAVNVGNEYWKDSVREGNAEWQDIIREGNENIRETIQNKNEQ